MIHFQIINISGKFGRKREKRYYQNNNLQSAVLGREHLKDVTLISPISVNSIRPFS